MTWTIEEHGEHYALYEGRTDSRHGLRLLNIDDVDPKTWERDRALITEAKNLYIALDKLLSAFHELLPGLRHISVSDYQNINQAPILAVHLLEKLNPLMKLPSKNDTDNQ